MRLEIGNKKAGPWVVLGKLKCFSLVHVLRPPTVDYEILERVVYFFVEKCRVQKGEKLAVYGTSLVSLIVTLQNAIFVVQNYRTKQVRPT